MADTSSDGSVEFDDRVINSAALLGTAADPKSLQDLTEKLVSLYLQHPNDAQVMSQTLWQLRAFFKAGAPLPVLQQFSVQVIRVVLASRPIEYYEEMMYAEQNEAARPPGAPELHHAPTEVIMVPPPKPVTCQTFQDLVSEALCYKVRLITGFFQRRNPLVMRGVKVPYLLSAAFEARMCDVVREIVVPMMFRQKSLSAMGSARPWRTVTTAALWLKPELHEDAVKIVNAWESVWIKLHQAEQAHHHPPAIKMSQAEEHAMARHRQTLLEIQHKLSGPEYFLPKLDMGQLKVFQTFLTNFDRTVMEQVWKGLRQTYEQELDRRSYQQKARHGALRDSFLTAFDLCSKSIGEMLVILAYYAFPKMSLHWLEMFSMNMGGGRDERTHQIPLLVRFLEQDDAQRAYKREPPRVLLDLEASAVIHA
ncbi:MAG TPA: hypothetical protein VM661_06390 [Candidatus Sulfotelmatobacter sp.]|jgi:hypothetical protein|nr:hypothetical protein [Candidatus Sulfotelmatobacter sp.]